MYSDLATWWPLLSPASEYAEEAAAYERALTAVCPASARTMLELGSGGGSNASYLKHRFEMVLVDLSAGMLDVSRALNPECEHIQGDMRTVRLGRQFDCVFVHDAIVYMTTVADCGRRSRPPMCTARREARHSSRQITSARPFSRPRITAARTMACEVYAISSGCGIRILMTRRTSSTTLSCSAKRTARFASSRIATSRVFFRAASGFSF